MCRISKLSGVIFGLTYFLALTSEAFGQEPVQLNEASGLWLIIGMGAVTLLVLGSGAIWYRSKRPVNAGLKPGSKLNVPGSAIKNVNGPELIRKKSPGLKKLPISYQHSSPTVIKDVAEIAVVDFAEMPLSRFFTVNAPGKFEPLPHSDDEGLLTAIEETQEDFEEDAEIRNLSLRILAAFKTANSVTSLSQIALYDLSATLRSKAVSILTDFDHESVFETIVLACADPTREVRAAAARGLFRLSFDRADAWTRITETNDHSRMRQAARAAIEAGLVGRSLERLVHRDETVAYEAFALTALLIKSGETDPVFDALAANTDATVKSALLHVLKTVKVETSLKGLHDLIDQKKISTDLAGNVKAVIRSLEAVRT